MDKCQAVSQSNASNIMATNVMQTCVFFTLIYKYIVSQGEFSIQQSKYNLIIGGLAPWLYQQSTR